jgi:hypothetical protein
VGGDSERVGRKESHHRVPPPSTIWKSRYISTVKMRRKIFPEKTMIISHLLTKTIKQNKMKKRTFLHAMTVFYTCMSFIIILFIEKSPVLWPLLALSILAADRYHDLWLEEKRKMDNDLYEHSNY